MLARILLLLYATRYGSVMKTHFPFVHSSIASILECRRPLGSSPTSFLDTGNNNVKIRDWTNVIEKHESGADLPAGTKDRLIGLAHECDQFVFVQHGLQGSDAFYQKLIEWGSSNSQHSTAETLLACLLGLNRLEAAIRQATGHTTAGRAPLLKTMLAILDEQESHDSQNHPTAGVLRILLLPNPGLNLRNLLWHGFVAFLPRPWLALVLVLSYILERDYVDVPFPKNNKSQAELPNLRWYSCISPILERGEELLHTGADAIDLSWIPERDAYSSEPCDDMHNSFHQWFDLVKHWIRSEDEDYPLCACILLTCMLEHGLRQKWCEANDCPEDRLARPAVFYVTLDGHGQRYKHDVLLHPYVGDQDTIRNALISRIGGPTVALLTDLYCSPCGGPNVRATLAHGTWDEYLYEEVATDANAETKQSRADQSRRQIWDLLRVLLALVEDIGRKLTTRSDSISCVDHYQPLYSYTAATCRNLDTAITQLKRLDQLSLNPEHANLIQSAKNSMNLPLESIRKLHLPMEKMQWKTLRILSLCPYSSTLSQSWTEEAIFREHETNRVLASSGIARILLGEVAEACGDFRGTFEQALGTSGDKTSSTRQRRQKQRILAAFELVMCVYGFAAWTALMLVDHDLAGHDEDEDGNTKSLRGHLVQAVKRSRMTVSTVSTFLVTNTDRAMKSAQEYSRGKAIKIILDRSQTALIEKHAAS